MRIRAIVTSAFGRVIERVDSRVSGHDISLSASISELLACDAVSRPSLQIESFLARCNIAWRLEWCHYELAPLNDSYEGIH